MAEEVMTRRRGDTRWRIQEIALERFTDNGYDQTSLREIAEDLGVTKAALYHHFKSKEEILDSILMQVSAELDSLVSWMKSGPMTRERRIELLDRLSDIARGTPGGVMRCMQQNEAAFQNLESATRLVHELKHKLWEAALPEGSTLEDRMRMRLAVTAVFLANKVEPEMGGSVDERITAVRAIVADIVP